MIEFYRPDDRALRSRRKINGIGDIPRLGHGKRWAQENNRLWL
jgi:hypothetical protein